VVFLVVFLGLKLSNKYLFDKLGQVGDFYHVIKNLL